MSEKVIPEEWNETAEIAGRLALWVFTLMECRRLLKLAARAKTSATPESLKLQQEKTAKLQDIGPSNAPPIAGDPEGLNPYQRFIKDNPQYYDFPTYHDCNDIADTVRMYAIVAFCRIWTTGNRSEGTAKANKDRKDPTMANLRETMIGKAFSEAESRQRFDEFLDQLLKARDKVIAHADGSHANIRFEEALILTPTSNIVSGIDMEYFAECVDRLDLARPIHP
jgi:hypothetical protein